MLAHSEISVTYMPIGNPRYKYSSRNAILKTIGVVIDFREWGHLWGGQGGIYNNQIQKKICKNLRPQNICNL